jgi:hypothetical protein
VSPRRPLPLGNPFPPFEESPIDRVTSSPVTLLMRAAHFAQTFPDHPAAHPRIVTEQGHDVLYATWLIGNDYRNGGSYYGTFPPSFLNRLMALFPDADPSLTLQAFSGSLPEGPYLRCDIRREAEFACEVEALPSLVKSPRFRLVIADPPYSKADAAKYRTKMINRGTVTRALAQITVPGGHLAWVDCVWPMHAKAQWTTVGRITIIRSTNHRVRLLTLFERTNVLTSDRADAQAGPSGT